MAFSRKRVIRIGLHKYIFKDKITRITEFRIEINPLGNKTDSSLNFKGIEKLINLNNLTISGSNIDLLDFRPLWKLIFLESIDFRTKDKITKIPDLSGIKNLITVSFYNYDFITLNGIEKYQQVKVLYFWGNTTDFPNIGEISGLKNLQLLVICTSDDASISFKDIINLPQLKSIIIPNSGSVDFTGIGKLYNLEKIIIRLVKKINNITELKYLQELETLELMVDSSFVTLDFLIPLTYLKVIGLVYNNGGDVDLLDPSYERKKIDITPLKELKNLEVITLHGFIVDNFGILTKLPNLKDVDVAYSTFSWPNKYFLENDKKTHITTEEDYKR